MVRRLMYSEADEVGRPIEDVSWPSTRSASQCAHFACIASLTVTWSITISKVGFCGVQFASESAQAHEGALIAPRLRWSRFIITN